MSPESTSPGGSGPAAVPRLGIGTIVRHFQFGVGRVVAYEPGQYVIVFRGGDTRRVAFSFDGLEVDERKGDPETDRIRQAVREVLGEHGWIDVDLVLTDLAMPHMTGWDVVRAVKTSWPATPVGLITGTPEHLAEQREVVDALIMKPLTLESLRQGIRQVEASAAARRESREGGAGP